MQRSDHVTGHEDDVLLGVADDDVQRQCLHLVAAGDLQRHLVDRLAHAARSSQRIQQPFAPRSQRHACAGRHFADHRHVAGHVADDPHQHLGLIRLALQPAHHLGFNLLGRAACRWHLAGKRHVDSAVAVDHLFGKTGNPCRHRRRACIHAARAKQQSWRSLPHRHFHHVACTHNKPGLGHFSERI